MTKTGEEQVPPAQAELSAELVWILEQLVAYTKIVNRESWTLVQLQVLVEEMRRFAPGTCDDWTVELQVKETVRYKGHEGIVTVRAGITNPAPSLGSSYRFYKSPIVDQINVNFASEADMIPIGSEYPLPMCIPMTFQETVTFTNYLADATEVVVL